MIDNLYEKGYIQEKAFSIYIRNSENIFENQDASEIIFGGYDKSFFTGNLTKHNITDPTIWALSF